MEKDIVVEVAKRTGRELVDQVSETPFVVAPFALYGFVAASWTGIIIALVLTIAYLAYEQYQEVIKEIETSIDDAADAQADVVTPAEPVSQADAEVTKVSEEETK